MDSYAICPRLETRGFAKVLIESKHLGVAIQQTGELRVVRAKRPLANSGGLREQWLRFAIALLPIQNRS